MYVCIYIYIYILSVYLYYNPAKPSGRGKGGRQGGRQSRASAPPSCAGTCHARSARVRTLRLRLKSLIIHRRLECSHSVAYVMFSCLANARKTIATRRTQLVVTAWLSNCRCMIACASVHIGYESTI